uniref:Uncharacterized protein n=2 Tax=Spongospora subterranea TaxID=70186 RepID=A0A0H5QL36_9EUKA|eukprot:CRZ02728.1 hypothetical protein [Spongospora subterranea]
MYPLFRVMAECNLPLLVHCEVTDPQIDIFDRERVFIQRHLVGIIDSIPSLKVVAEHITTAFGVEFVHSARSGVAATITPHHLLENRNALFHGGLRPHYYCLPVLKTESDRLALLAAATSGSPRFFLGSDSAPHSRSAKESDCGCAGCFVGFACIELYAEAFDSVGKLHMLKDFACTFGAQFYGLSPSDEQDTIILRKRAWTVPKQIPYIQDEYVIPFKSGQTLQWSLS